MNIYKCSIYDMNIIEALKQSNYSKGVQEEVCQYISDIKKENERLYSIIKEVRELAIIKKARVENEPDYSKSYLEGYENAIQAQHLSHSGVMLETIKSTIKTTCNDFLEILDKEEENENND